MSTKKNPYRDGSAYAKVFNDLRQAGQKGITRQELIEKGNKSFDVSVILTPRNEGVSTRDGDCRGHTSAQGHIYYVEKRKVEGEKARFVMRWRKTELDKLVRIPRKEVKSQKTIETKIVKPVEVAVEA